MFPEDGQTRKHRFLAMFPEGEQTRRHYFLAMFPQTMKHCYLVTLHNVAQHQTWKYLLLYFPQVTQETTIENYNNKLWQYIKAESVMEWARAVVANRIAQDGRQWTSLFSRDNSGT